MIRNERQYRVTGTQRDNIASQLAQLDPSAGPQWAVKATRDALISQIADLETELSEYESLQSDQTMFNVPNLSSLPRELIRARIARRMSQKELALQLQIKEQQVQRYEATDYIGASVARLSEVMDALGVQFAGELNVPGTSNERDQVKRALSAAGLSRATIDNRFFATAEQSAGSWLNAASRAARVFRTDVKSVLAGSVGNLGASGAFRAVGAANRDRLTGYAIYAEYLAELAVKVCPKPYRPLPSVDEIRFRHDEGLTSDPLVTLLQVCWSHGVPVVPVTDSGAFYGACWFVEDRPAIVLKNQVRTPERWAFLLAHEMEHVRNGQLTSVLESGLDVSDWHDQPAELAADASATRLLLGGDAEALAAAAIELAESSSARLKTAVMEVAEAEDVAVGLLADYVAHRVQRPGVNWWPTANTLHNSQSDAWLTTRAMLFSCVDLDRLDELDRDILIDGMAP